MRMTVSREHRLLEQGCGETRVPHAPVRGRVWEGAARAQGYGETGFPHTPTRWEGLGSAAHAQGRGKPGFPIPPFASGGVRRNHSPFLKRQHSLTQVLDKPRPGLLLSEPAHTQPDAQLIQSGGGTGPVKPRQPPGASRRHCRRLEAPARCQFRQKNLEDERHARRSILCIASDCPHRMPMRAFLYPQPAGWSRVGNPGFPAPPPAGGPGPHAGVWGNQVSPHPRPREGLGGLRPPRNKLCSSRQCAAEPHGRLTSHTSETIATSGAAPT